MSKTLDEWIEIYEKKADEKFNPKTDRQLVFDSAKGFCQIGFSDGKLFVYQVCGDGKHWRNFAEYVARNLGIENCGTTCVRKNIRAFIRLLGYHITKTNEKNNLKCFSVEDANENKAIVYECIFESEKHGYKIFWEVPKAGEINDIRLTKIR